MCILCTVIICTVLATSLCKHFQYWLIDWLNCQLPITIWLKLFGTILYANNYNFTIWTCVLSSFHVIFISCSQRHAAHTICQSHYHYSICRASLPFGKYNNRRRSIVTANTPFSFLSFYFIIPLSHLLLSDASSPQKQAQSSWNLNARFRMISVLIATFFGIWWGEGGYKMKITPLCTKTWKVPPLSVGKWRCSCSDSMCIMITKGN